MTYRQAVDVLFGIRRFGQRLELDTMRRLAGKLGNPHERLKFLHVAGTNGKGSVCAMLQAIFHANGCKTGMYTSPHLVSFCERFRVGDSNISESDVVRLVEKVMPLGAEIAALPGGREPTFFEVVTAMALQYFADQNVDYVVWETGLGGRLDATNIVTPVVSVITSIGFDHMQYLGDTLAKIAGEKAGIIKPGIPVVTAATGEALEVIRATAARHGSPLTVIGSDVCARRDGNSVELAGTRQDYGRLTIPLLGEHQAANCATAIAALDSAGIPLRVDAVRQGLAKTRWPGRFQVIHGEPTVVLDGAHNVPGAQTLVDTMREQFSGKLVALIVGVLKDKDVEGVVNVLSGLTKRVFCVPVANDRTSHPVELAGMFGSQAEAVEGIEEAWNRAKRTGVDVVVITGSLFLVGEALAQLRLPGTETARDSRELRLQ
jgi:dihydrofolate synthase/folylpolyglutamate synthase